ncbi:OmpP1/FadL family transporter [Pontiella agarivorans]|uniref:Outer membrane protein transport protein n=1 Tax=Pontiella agarivorans TaxID=3038953 RepID=A0ABU5MV04_9BACT|nr:outer membrane protein transport protein [Pontiella agarivorans]MDZ8118049.1 outer membrane protein transport protein [Pontiella agarivorans]
MNKNHKLFVSGICAGLFVLSRAVMADGYRNPPPTAEGIAKSGVNSVWVDDASAISYNPANLAFQTNQSFVLSTTFARTENTYQNPLAPNAFESDGEWNYLPNIYYALPLGDRCSVGLGINTPYGQGLSWDKDDFAPFVTAPGVFVPYEAQMMMINFNPTVAAKLTDTLALGAGLNVAYSQLTLKALQGTPGPTVEVEGEGDGWGVGANLGLTWNPVEGQRLTLTYRNQMQIDYEGDFKVDGAGAGTFETEIKLPNIIGVGYGFALNDKVQIEALVEWLQWSLNDSQKLVAGAPAPDLENNWDDTFTFGIGGSWQALDSLVVRAGYAFIPSPIPDETITPLLPDADRHAVSFGLGYTRGAHTIDLAYTVSIYEDRSAPVSNLSGAGIYDIDSNLIGLTYSIAF